MTRKELAKALSKDLKQSGVHYENGSTVWKTIAGEWGAYPGESPPPQDALWYRFVGWDARPQKNTSIAIEQRLRNIEKSITGFSKRILHS